MQPATRARVNRANLSTPLGLALARAGGATVHRAPRGLLLARGYALRLPAAPAFTVGNVILVRSLAPPGRDPVASLPATLLHHEERHATQYAWCGGVLMPLLYVGAAGWSWLRTGDFASRNVFEQDAGLLAGGYREHPARPARESLTQLRALVRRPRTR